MEEYRNDENLMQSDTEACNTGVDDAISVNNVENDSTNDVTGVENDGVCNESCGNGGRGGSGGKNGGGEKEGRSGRGGFWRRMCAIAVGAALFGSVASVSFYGVSRLLPSDGVPAESQPADETTGSNSGGTQGGASGASGGLSLTGTSSGGTIGRVSVTDDGVVSGQSLDVSDVARAAMPAMVAITNTSVEEVQNYFGMFGRGQTQTQEVTSSGSGIIIAQNETELLIVTNNHVIEDAQTLSVSFIDDTVVSASVKGADSDNDIAVISVRLADISDETKQAIRIATLNTDDDLEVGQQVVAIGNALGYGQSVTTGIISALGRTISTSTAVMIQTDAAINPGNSGGALLNMRGEVIGINSAKYSSTNVEGMGYAISMETAVPVIETLMSRVTREKVSAQNAAYLGISCEDVTSAIESAYGIPRGIYVAEVSAGGPAEAAGITARSVITHFDGVRVTTTAALRELLEYYAAGETVSLTVQVPSGNSYAAQVVTITLGHAE